MEKETYIPQVYIKIDKIIFKTESAYPTLEKNDNRRFNVYDNLWSDIDKFVTKEKKDEVNKE